MTKLHVISLCLQVMQTHMHGLEEMTEKLTERLYGIEQVIWIFTL